MAAMGLETSPEQILLTESGTHSIDLVCRFLLEPGDTVLIDDPCYFNFHALLKAHRVQAVSVPYTPQGPDVARFADALQAHSPRLYITNSAIHNPTGATLSPLVAHRILKLADSSDLVIVEDDIFCDLETHAAPRLAAFDGLSRVIQIGSFSKTVSASLRCGSRGAARLDAGPGGPEDRHQLRRRAHGRRHRAAHADRQRLPQAHGVRAAAAGAGDGTHGRAAAGPGHEALAGAAGRHVPVVPVARGMDATALARTCLEDGVVLAPGNAFSQSQSAGDFLRFNVAQCSDARIFEVLARALKG